MTDEFGDVFAEYHLPCVVGNTIADDPSGATICPSPDRKDTYLELDYMSGHEPDDVAIAIWLVTRTKIVQSPLHVNFLTTRGTVTRTALATGMRIVQLAVIPVKFALMTPQDARPGMRTVTTNAMMTRVARPVAIWVRPAMLVPVVIFGISTATVMVFATGVNPARPVAIEETLALPLA